MVFSTAPFLYLIVSNIWQLAIIRFYHGLSTAIFIPVSMAMVSDLFHSERGEKIGWFSTATLAAGSMAPVTGGSITGAMVVQSGTQLQDCLSCLRSVGNNRNGICIETPQDRKSRLAACR